MQARALGQVLTTDAITHLLAFRDAVVQQFPGTVHDVVLFGSRVRGDAQPGSDYDVAVVLSWPLALDRNHKARCQLADAAWEHVIDGYAIIPIALSPDELPTDGSGGTELGVRIAAEGISLR